VSLFFEVGDCEHSVIGQSDILDADELPSLIAQIIEIILNVFYDWFTVGFEMISANLCLYQDHLVLPLNQPETPTEHSNTEARE
jgi:hypothetical protein